MSATNKAAVFWNLYESAEARLITKIYSYRFASNRAWIESGSHFAIDCFPDTGPFGVY